MTSSQRSLVSDLLPRARPKSVSLRPGRLLVLFLEDFSISPPMMTICPGVTLTIESISLTCTTGTRDVTVFFDRIDTAGSSRYSSAREIDGLTNSVTSFDCGSIDG